MIESNNPLAVGSIHYSSKLRTVSLNLRPRSNSFTNMPNDAHPGERITVSPGIARAMASLTARESSSKGPENA